MNNWKVPSKKRLSGTVDKASVTEASRMASVPGLVIPKPWKTVLRPIQPRALRCHIATVNERGVQEVNLMVTFCNCNAGSCSQCSL